MDNSLSLTGLQDSGGNNITSSTTLAATPGGTVALTGTGDGGTNLTYKIVADNNGVREIVGYGQSADNTSMTIDAKDLNGANLADRDYTVYVWAQKNELINSNTGSEPQYFTMTVATPAQSYAVAYAAGGAAGGNVPVDANSYPSGSSVTVLGNTGGLHMTNYTFAGWKNSADNVIYQPGQSFTITGNVTLTAQWSYNGGSYMGGGSPSRGFSSSYSTPSSGGAYIPPPVWNIVTDKQPNLPKTATLTHLDTLENSRLKFTITRAMVQAALDRAGADPDGIGLVFNVTGGGFAAQTITFEEGAIVLLKSSGVKFVQVNTGLFRFRFDAKAIDQLDALTTGPVSVSANPATLYAEAKKLIGNRPAFDVTVQFQKDGKAYNVLNFGDGKMARWIAYKPAAGENAGNLAAVHVDKNGRPSWVDGSAYENGWLGWTGNTCSVYGVGYKPAASTPALALAAGFADTKGHWAKEYIDFVVGRGLVSGTGAAAFSPDAPMTRAVFLSALGKLAGVEANGYTASSFTDVPNTDPAMPYIEWAVAGGIVSGVGDNMFGPDSTITREQMAVMMVNYAEAIHYTLPAAVQAESFTDADKISAYAKDAVTAVQQAGIIVGKGGGVFDPAAKATRA